MPFWVATALKVGNHAISRKKGTFSALDINMHPTHSLGIVLFVSTVIICEIFIPTLKNRPKNPKLLIKAFCS